MSEFSHIKERLEAFRRRFHRRELISGFFGFLIVNSIFFLIISLLEHVFWLESAGRIILLSLFLLSVLVSGYLFVITPLLRLLEIKKGISDEEAARQIARYFPQIEDKLLNTLQLNRHADNALIKAAIEKKSQELSTFSFIQAVDFSPIKKYAMGLAVICFIFVLLSFVSPSVISESPARIVDFKTHYEPKAPFQFEVENEMLSAFRGEDFTFSMVLTGEEIPEKAKIYIDNKKSGRLISVKNGKIQQEFSKIQSRKTIQVEAAGFRSPKYEINVYDRPDLVSMIIRVQEPKHTGGALRTIENSGNLTIPEGSLVSWELQTLATDSLSFVFDEKKQKPEKLSKDQFLLESTFLKTQPYKIVLFNEHSTNKSDLGYSLEVIKDAYPKITAQFFPDSITYQSITVAGSIADDYGFSNLNLNYRKENTPRLFRIPLEINPQNTQQSFFAIWNLDTLSLKPGETLEVFLSVHDNDGVNGPKETRSRSFLLKTPSEKDIDALISEKQKGVEDQLNESEEKAEKIAERLKEIEERLKSRQTIDWQEKKLIDDIIKDREKLNEQIEELNKKHEQLLKSNQKFQKQSPQLQEKSEKLQELMQQMMDEETRELYEKLKKLMEENAPSDQVTDQIDQLRKNEQNLERDLERALELFKRLKMESALEQNLQKLDTLSTKQENLANDPASDLKKQQEINEEFDEFRKKMDEIEQMNQDLKRPEALENFELEERQIAKELKEIEEQLKDQENNQSESPSEPEEQKEGEGQQEPTQGDNKPKKGGVQQKQQDAAQKMKNLSQKLSKMQGGMQMEMMQANLDQLRDILDNLIKLSFNQEEVMKEMREVNQSDPRFLELSQQQLKLKDDAKVIEDSLLSLASKVVQISSFVTREVAAINENMEEAIDQLRDRNRNRALSSQQFAMTSINNLALLLDDTMQQMQMAMAESMGNNSKGDKQQPQGLPDLQELQNQLGEKINELKGSGKQGRELSEELARLAAEQEMIRRQMELLKEAEDGKPGGGRGSDDLKQAIDMMEQNEVDLVNKRLTQQLINRQKQIITRMLEAEKAQRDQEMDEEREARRPGIISREIPPGYEKYLELKKKEIELLKTIPIEFNPFYKKEVNDYFRRLSSEQQDD